MLAVLSKFNVSFTEVFICPTFYLLLRKFAWPPNSVRATEVKHQIQKTINLYPVVTVRKTLDRLHSGEPTPTGKIMSLGFLKKVLSWCWGSLIYMGIMFHREGDTIVFLDPSTWASLIEGTRTSIFPLAQYTQNTYVLGRGRVYVCSIAYVECRFGIFYCCVNLLGFVIESGYA